MEPCAKKITRKNNPALVAAVFRLMFETLWIPLYDRRKCNALVVDFELCARSAVIRLAATDLAAASGGASWTKCAMPWSASCGASNGSMRRASCRPSGVPKPWKPCAAWLPGCVNGVPARCECGDLLPVASGVMLR